MAASNDKKKSKNQIRRERLKEKKKQQQQQQHHENGTVEDTKQAVQESLHSEPNEEPIEPVDSVSTEEMTSKSAGSSKIFESEIDQYLDDPNFQEFKKVLNRFYMPEETGKDGTDSQADDEKGNIIYSDEEGSEGESSDDEKTPNGTDIKLSKRQLKKLNKIPLAVLKARAKRPEAVEWYDVDAPDAELLVYIKCLKNVVPVPIHWQLKREYLSLKRGIEKPPFELPKYIKDTGIVDMRDTTQLDTQTLKQKVREKVQPKMGKLDLDYAKLHDAFFKYQEKPKLLGYGDVYYEGREFDEIDIKGFRPGKISNKLRFALGIPEGAPPPWLINMNRFGPPPSYPNLNIMQLYTGDSSFYQPYEENIKGIEVSEDLLEPVEKEHWGILRSVEEEDEEEDEDEDEDEEDEDEEVGYDEGSEEEGPTKISADETEAVPISSVEVHSGFTNPSSTVQQTALDVDGKPKKLYEVLEEEKPQDTREGFMGGHTYKIHGRRGRNEFEEEDSRATTPSKDDMAAKRARYESQKKAEDFKF